MLKTGLYDWHRQRGAKFVDFASWHMPLHYSQGILHEHRLVRTGVGAFDVSHMGCFSFRGKDAEGLVNYLSCNQVLGRSEGTATYTPWASASGGTVDDVMLFKKSPEDFLVVVNAGNRQKALQHARSVGRAFSQVEIFSHYDTEAIVALQGPRAIALMSDVYPSVADLAPMAFVQEEVNEAGLVLISRTGYTGAGGVELIGAHKAIRKLWERLFALGAPYALEPVGLGARDTLRLEMGYALYGHELSDSIAPTESVAAWAVKLGKSEDFLGKETLLALEQSGKKRVQVGLLLEEKGIPREGYPVFYQGEKIGEVTSGAFSPSLHQGMAIALVKAKPQEGAVVEVQIRQNKVKARVQGLPLLKVNGGKA